MFGFLIYDLKVAALIAVFYMFYRLMLSRETFHHVNRLVLLTTAVASFLLPLCVITLHRTVVMQQAPTVKVGDLQAVVLSDTTSSAPLWQQLALALYIIGVLAVLGRTLWSVRKVILLIRRSEKHPMDDDITLCVTGLHEVAPFSWMHYIVMNRSDYEQRDAAILAHERGHIRLHHSWNIVFVDLLTALQWFNPAIWMLRQDLRAIHEYEADSAVLSQGINARQYQYLLITKASGIGGYSIANGISHSTLKNRITMMLHKKSQTSRLLKLLALVPVVGIALALNAETVTDVVYQQPQKKIVKKGKKNATTQMGNTEVVVTEETSKEFVNTSETTSPPTKEVKQNSEEIVDDDAFDVVEHMPQFPGGYIELANFLGRKMNYPKEAHEKDIQGSVIVTFVIEKDGSITEARVVKSVNPLLDAEALRAVNAMPHWTPGMQNDKPVRVKYTIPIMFRLDDGSSSEDVKTDAIE